MADLHVDWKSPILLKKDGKHSLTFATDGIPSSAGVYMFFRRTGKNTTEVVYVGKAKNLQKRTNLHNNSHKLIKALLDKKGRCYLLPGVFKSLGGQVAEKAIVTIERVLIRKCIEDGHPLINVAGARIRTQHVISTLPAGAKFLSTKIGFEPGAGK